MAKETLKIDFPHERFKVLYPEYSKGKKHIIVKGGRASTKSWSIAAALVDHCRTYTGLRVMCGREVQNSISESSKKLIDDTIDRLGLRVEFKSTNTYIEHRVTGSTIKFMGLEGNHESIKGLEKINIFWVEEAQSVSQGSLDVLIPTMRAPGAQIWYSYNPKLPTTPVEQIPRRYPDMTEVVHINYLDVLPYLDENLIKEAEADKEDDIDRYNWIWLGQYMAQSADTFIPLGLVTEAVGRPFSKTDEGVVAGLDIGIFHDRSVLVVRQGPNVIEAKEWKNFNVEDLCEQIVGYVNHYGIRKLAVDSNGQGAGPFQMLRKRLGDIVVGIMPGAAAREKKKYSKVRDESWGRMKEWLEKGSLPRRNEREWITDITNIKFFYDDQGRYKIESKRQYLSRGFNSTDYADALGYSLLITPSSGSYEWWQRENAREFVRERYNNNYPSDWMGI